ncbi:hypothetical protein BDV23DRAFT_151126 [Aspergillus alliaceus]|uniref:Uncharacterized protein n=1 Tax=Petromyces alliaceus TaxID=209559 RepID=A0A5N7CF12_PETAA|nr:hypothetical protein BDV23DRAFT_151126 [Aspergillus alliaceus]
MPSSFDGGKRHFVIPRPSHLRLLSRTYGPDAIRELSKLEEWYDTWDTLTVHKDEAGSAENVMYTGHTALQT